MLTPRHRSLPLRACAAVLALSILGGLTACSTDQMPVAADRSGRQTESGHRTKEAKEVKEAKEAKEKDKRAEGQWSTAGRPASVVPDSWPGGPSRKELRRAMHIVGRMSVDERAGQVVVAAYDGTTPPAQLVRQHHLGGVILFEASVGDPVTLASRLHALQKHSGRSFPLWIGVDQEGGVVRRLGPPFTGFGPYMAQGAARSERLARQVAKATARELAAAGFTAVFAPDGDVTIGPADPTIGSRSAGDEPRLVARTVIASMTGYERGGVLPVVKHFPGHGSVPADSHIELPVQEATLAQLRARDLLPFARAVRHGAPAVMAGHIDVRALDPGVPSSLSRPVLTGLLRHDLGYDGLVVTDSLGMGAVIRTQAQVVGQGAVAVRALLAGVDVLLMPPEPIRAVRLVAGAVRSGLLPGWRLREAATRMVGLLLHQRHLLAGKVPDRVRSHPEVAQRQARKAITSVSGPCVGRLVGPAVRPLGTPAQVAAFASAAGAAGLPVSSAPEADTVALRGQGASPTTADVVVATDTPYLLGPSAAAVKIATFGAGPAAMRALVDVLTGRASAPGRLPVQVAGVTRRGC